MKSPIKENPLPRVWNKRDSCCPKDAIYIGRHPDPKIGKWGNPYTHLKNGTQASFLVDTRAMAIQAYKHWLQDQPELLKALPELRGKDLACWCTPLDCHGNVLLEMANGPYRCTICNLIPVDVENGIDTCDSCTRRM